MDRAVEVLNFYRNRHYNEPDGTEEKELADAINEILPHYAALREQEQSNEPLTLEELMVLDAPVWCACKPIEGGDGYWCLCRKGHITTPAGSCYYVSEIPHWVFLRHKPKEGAEE